MTSPITFTSQQSGQISTNLQARTKGNQHTLINPYHNNNFRGCFRGRGRFRGCRFNGGRGRGSYNPASQTYPQAPVYNALPSNYRHPEHFSPPLLPTPASIADQTCHNCNHAGHTARTCNNKRNYAFNTRLFGDDYNTHSLHNSAPSVASDHSWCLDSGTSNHMTSSLNLFSTSQPYQGNDTVMVENGSQLPIF